MTRLRRRIAKETGEPIRTDKGGASRKLEELQNREKIEEKKRLEFSEKIDELNQETNTLMDEIDKWQT